MPGKLKQNLLPNQRVIIKNTTSVELDEKYATVIGIAFAGAEFDFYIVQLDQPLLNGLIESCIDELSNEYQT